MKGILNRLLLGKTLTTKPAVVAAAGILGGLFFTNDPHRKSDENNRFA